VKISINALTKTYPKGVRALDGITLEINSGMFGLLGPNGAGKTTLLSILATLVKPTSGTVHIDGWDASDHKQQWLIKNILGYLPQEPGLYPELTSSEFLHYMATLKGFHTRQKRRTEAQRLLDAVGLEEYRHRKTKTLSGGMRRRLGIAQALIGDPRLLIVDEPTAGLDPAERVRFRTLLANIATDRIVILSTHIVEDIAATSNDLAVLQKGRLLFRGSPTELTNHAKDSVWEVLMPPGQAANPTWRVAASITEPAGTRLRILGNKPTPEATALKPNLEDGYIRLLAEHSPIP